MMQKIGGGESFNSIVKHGTSGKMAFSHPNGVFADTYSTFDSKSTLEYFGGSSDVYL